MIHALGTGRIRIGRRTCIVIGILCIIHHSNGIICNQKLLHGIYGIIGKIGIFQISSCIVRLRCGWSCTGFLCMRGICSQRHIPFCCHSGPCAQKHGSQKIISALMIIYVSFIICPHMLIDIPVGISKWVILSVCEKIRQMLFRQIIGSKPLGQKRCFQKRGHSKCPAHTVGLLVLYGSDISLIRCIIIGRIGRSSSHWYLIHIISDLHSGGIRGQIIKGCQLFLLFFLRKRTALDIFDAGLITVRGIPEALLTVAKGILLGILLEI